LGLTEALGLVRQTGGKERSETNVNGTNMVNLEKDEKPGAQAKTCHTPQDCKYRGEQDKGNYRARNRGRVCGLFSSREKAGGRGENKKGGAAWGDKPIRD